MSQAEALLNTLTDAIPEHEHPVNESGVYFLIDPVSRQLDTTERVNIVLMQFDHDSKRFTFRLPRRVEGHDMSLCNRVLVHWNNIDETTGRETAETSDIYDLHINPDNKDEVVCSWLISRNSTQQVGILSFLIQYKCVADDGTETYEWHTDSYDDVEILKGRNNGPQSVIDYTDILEQWRQRIFGEADSVITNIESEGDTQVERLRNEASSQMSAVASKGEETLATIPADYTATYNMANSALRTRANAIVNSAEGESIVVTDSSDDYLRGLKLYGKTTQVTTTGAQLFDASRIPTTSNSEVTLTNNGDGSFTISGTGTTTVSFSKSHTYTHEETVNLLKAGNITLTAEKVTRPYLYLSIHNSGGRLVELNTADKATSTTEILEEWLNDSSTYMIVGFYTGANATVTTGTIKPMVYQSGKGAWESFSGGKASPSPDYPQEIISVDNPTVRITGKNLYEGSDDWSGVWDNANKWSDGGIFNGMSVKTESTFKWSGLYKKINITAGVTYTFSAFVKSNLESAIFLVHADNKQSACLNKRETNLGPSPEWTRPSVTFTATEDMVITPRVERRVDGTDPIYVCGYQLEIGDSMTEYESYHGSSISFERTLPGIPVTSGGNYTDRNGQQWICDEIDFERGVYVQRIMRYAVTGEEGWYLSGLQKLEDKGIYRYDANYVSRDSASLSNVLCTHYSYPTILNLEKGCWVLDDASQNLALRIMWDYATVGELKDYLSEQYANGTPVTLYYVLATPIETPLTDEELFNFSQLHSNYPTTTILNDSNVKMEVKYNADTQAYFNNSRGASDEQVERSVDAWLTKYFSNAEEVSF